MIPNAAIQPKAQERRRHSRVKIALLGRYMLADRREFPCQTIDISPGGLSITAPVVGEIGERVIVYLDHLGRLEGQIVRRVPNGFAMTIAAPLRKREKLANQLTWLANRGVLGLPEDRRHERVVPKNPRAELIFGDGHTVFCMILDVSLSGAAVRVAARPPINSLVTLGRTPAKVVRHFEDGIALEFTRPHTMEQLRAEFE